jgi:hypothetical protein
MQLQNQLEKQMQDNLESKIKKAKQKNKKFFCATAEQHLT